MIARRHLQGAGPGCHLCRQLVRRLAPEAVLYPGIAERLDEKRGERRPAASYGKAG